MVDDDSLVTLLNFETYGQSNAPKKFKIEVTTMDSTSVIEVDPKLDTETKKYGVHNIGYVFDTSKVKIEIIAVTENESKNRLSFRLHYLMAV